MTLRRLLVVPAALAVCMALAGPAGAATFGPAVPFPAGGFYMGTGDLNADGKLDVALSQFNAGPDNVTVLTGDGDGTFTTQAPLTAGNSPNDVVVADFNADSKPDLAVENFFSTSVSMFLNTTPTPGAAPTFAAAVNYTVGAGNARNTTATADFDADGKRDLAVPNFSASTVSVLLGDGAGVLGAPSPFATAAGNLTQYAATGNLNGDTKPDLATANWNANNVSVLLNTTAAVGTPTFGPKVDTTTGAGARAVAIGNLNGDANGDVAAVNATAPGTLTVLRGNGNGTFQPPSNITIGPDSAGVAIGDLDADGRQDIAVSRPSGAGVLIGNGNGTFQPMIPLSGAGGSDVVIADVNGDSRPDVLTDQQVFLNTTIDYRVFVTNSLDDDMSLIDTTTNTLTGPGITVGGGPSAIAITPDGTRAYVVNTGDDDVSVINTATNAPAGPDIAVGGSPTAIAITPDGTRAYVTNLANADVSVINTATNTLAGPDVTVGGGPQGIAITPDGARAYVTNEFDNDVSVIDTATNALAGADITVGSVPWGIAITPDGTRAYVANIADGDVSVIDTATNMLAAPDITVGATPRRIAITPDGASAYVVNTNDDDISVIDTATNALAGSDVAVGNGPQEIAFTPDGTRAYVTNQLDDDVSQIDTATNTLAGPDIAVGNAPEALAITDPPAVPGGPPGPGPPAGPGGPSVGTVGPLAAAAGLPAPVAGRRFNAQVVSGRVFFKCRGQKRRRLEATTQLPIGCLIDAREGRVRIIAAANADATKVKSAVFYEGQFTVHERRSKQPVTELRLAGALVGCKKGKASAAAKRRKGRRLWGNGKGRFRTRGKRSSALVRGTIWLVEDRCNDTTFTRVRKGVVQVRDFARKRNITVRAGRTYTAKARKR